MIAAERNLPGFFSWQCSGLYFCIPFIGLACLFQGSVALDGYAVPRGRDRGGRDWPQFRGRNRDGISKETGLLKSWPKKGPPRVWEREIGPGYSGPVVAGNRLIAFYRDGDKEVVECFDAAR